MAAQLTMTNLRILNPLVGDFCEPKLYILVAFEDRRGAEIVLPDVRRAVQVGRRVGIGDKQIHQVGCVCHHAQELRSVPMVTAAAPGRAGRVTTSGRLVTDLAGAGGGTVTNERGGQKNGDIERASRRPRCHHQ